MQNSTDFKIPTMKTIKEVVEITGVKEFRVRQLVKNELITFLRCGNKKVLINLEKFIDFLNNPQEITQQPQRTNKFNIQQIN